MRAIRPFFLLALSLLLAPPAAAAGVSFGQHDVRSVFHVAKSENRNQVHYAVRLDGQCRPTGKQPVFAYWRRLKKGVRVDEPLVSPGTRVYGPADQPTIESKGSETQVHTFVKALSKLRIEITIEKAAKGCTAKAMTTLNGERVRLTHAFLQLGSFALRVKYVDVFGNRVSDGKPITQRFR